MNKFLKLNLSVALMLSLTACGGSGDEEKAIAVAVAPTIDKPLEITVVDLVGASSVFLTGDDGTASPSNTKSLSRSISRSISPTSYSTRAVSIKNTGTTSDVALSANTLYKIMPDGTLDAVPLGAAGEDARGAVKPLLVKSIGNGWTAISFAVDMVQRVLSGTLPDGTVDYTIAYDDLSYTYLVNNLTGKAFRADFLGTPILDYNKGDIALYDVGRSGAYDVRTMIRLTDGQIDNIFDTISFDGKGDLYVLARVADEAAWESDHTEVTKEVLLKINTSDTASNSLTATEIPIVFNTSIDYDSFKITNDGQHLFFNDGQYRYTSTQTNETLVITDTNGIPFDLVFTVQGSGNTYAARQGGQSVEIYSLNIVESELATELLSDKPYVLHDIYTEFTLPHSDNVQLVNGYIIVGSAGYYAVFDENTNQFVQTINLNSELNSTLKMVRTERSLLALTASIYGPTEIVKWTPNPSLTKSQTVTVMDISSELFQVHSINLTGDDFLSFTAKIINPLEGYNIGDVVLARTSLLVDNAAIEIRNVFSINEPIIIFMEEISQGDTVSVDGQNNDWSIDYRVITDTVGDTLKGDLSFVSMTESSNKLWFLIEAASSLSGVQTTLNLSATKKLTIQNNMAYFVSNGIESRLTSAFGIFAATDKNIELSLPKALLAGDTLLLSSKTTDIVAVEGDVYISSATLEGDVAQLTLLLNSAIGSATVDIAMSSDVSVVITEPTSGNYSILVNDSDISTLGGSVSVTNNKLTFSFTLSSLGLDSTQYFSANASITSEPKITLGELLDEAL